MTAAATTLLELSEAAAAWLRDGRGVVSALLVDIEGSAPLPPGAMMLIDEHGNIEGSITGGCVEGAVVQEADEVLEGAPPKLLRYGISDDLAGTVGLTCGGVVHVFVHPLAGEAARMELAVLEAARAGRPAAIATLLDTVDAGAKTALTDGTISGSFGGPDLLDRNVARELEGLLEEGKTALRRFGEDGATMGTELRVHMRSFAPAPRMLVIGAVDFAAALAPIAGELGYAVTICDARERFARSPRFQRAAEISVGWPQEAITGRDLGPRDAVLVFTHDPKFDEPALIAALQSGAGYIGALGSRRTTEDRARRLRDAGIGDAEVARIHAPCGLDIGSRTPEETAISVLAEIIATRTARTGEALRGTRGPIHSRDE